MAVQIENLGSESYQIHNVIFEQSQVVIDLFFSPVVERWFFDVSYNGFSAKGIAVSLGTTHIKELNQPFDILCEDTSGLGIDPFQLDDFSSDRCRLYLLDRDDMFQLRGFDVPS